MAQAQDDLRKLLFNICAKYNIDPVVFGAIITIESAWKIKSVRYESNFIYLENPNKWALRLSISPDTERALQRFSWGLCQIMGANARSVGFQDPLTDLLDPATNLDIGVKFFARRCAEYVYPSDQAAVWNFGSIKRLADGKYVNQKYVDKFNQAYEAAKEALMQGPSISGLVSILDNQKGQVIPLVSNNNKPNN